MLRRSSVAGVVGLALVCFATPAGAKTISVNPGPDAIQDAVDDASRGDTLRIKRGTYREDVEIDKRLKLIGQDGNKKPVINGQCDTSIVVNLTHSGVLLKRLKVKGAVAQYNVNIAQVEKATIRNVDMVQTCNSDRAYYGVNVNSTGAVKIVNSRAYGGFSDAGIYVGSISDTNGKTLLVQGNETYGNNVGILIEDAFGPQGKVLVKGNFTHGNDFDSGLSDPAGILVRRSDRTRYVGNRANNNGEYGIQLDSDSEDNVLIDNQANGNPDGNLFDEGAGNCGSGNSFSIDPC